MTGPLPGRCNPAWNPASGSIAYMAGGDLIGTDLRSLTPDDGNVRELASDEGDNQDPQFSLISVGKLDSRRRQRRVRHHFPRNQSR